MNTDKNVIVVLDPGHGPDTPGKRWTSTDEASGGAGAGVEPSFYEWKWNREYSKVLMGELLLRGYRVFLTVEGEEPDKALLKRVQFANNLKEYNRNMHCLYISLHVDAAESAKAHGLSVWTTKGFTNSDVLADYIIESIKTTGYKVRLNSPKQYEKDYEANFYVIKNAAMPAVLIEHGFMTNKEDRALLRQESTKTMLASATADAVDAYCNHMNWID